MDGLMNKIATLVEEHVKSEVEARLLLCTEEPVGQLQDENERLRERVLALELKLLEVRKVVAEDVDEGAGADVDEVDGFRVGDLVRYWRIDSDCEYLPIVKFQGSEAVYITNGERGHYENAIEVAELRRKPVGVGDTVRVSGRSGEQFVVESYSYDEGEEWARCRSNPLSSDLIRSSRLIAIAD